MLTRCNYLQESVILASPSEKIIIEHIRTLKQQLKQSIIDMKDSNKVLQYLDKNVEVIYSTKE